MQTEVFVKLRHEERNSYYEKERGESALEDEKGSLIILEQKGISKGLQTEVMFKASLHEWLEIQKACGAEAFYRECCK